MDPRRRSLTLLHQADWGEDALLMARFQASRHYPLLLAAIEDLKVEALYRSPVHGSGHINRVLLLSGLIGWLEDVEESLLRQYLLIASYHDVGRSFDGLDLTHGAASALQLEGLTGYRGEPLRQMCGAVKAHSQPDARMEEMVASYEPADMTRAMALAALLKDADNLDRVRMGDLNADFLRSESAKTLAPFARRLFQLDQHYKTRQ